MKFLEKLAELFKEEVPAPIIEQKPVELKKRTKKLVSRKEMVDLGVTSVLLKFQDGRELITKVYGNTNNAFGNDGNDEYFRERFRGGSVLEPVIEPMFSNRMNLSSEVSENYIREVEGEEGTYVDCTRKPTVSFVGKVISAQIIRTEQCLEEVTKYSVEPI